MHTAHVPRQYFLFNKATALLLLFIFCSLSVHAVTYNLSTGAYPPCVGGTWTGSSPAYRCNAGRVTLANGDTVVANATATITADNGFTLAGNTIGSVAVRINLSSTNGTIISTGTNVIYGAVNNTSGNLVDLVNTTINGTLTSNATNTNLTGGAVTGLVTCGNGILTTNGTNLGGGASVLNSMSITGGTVAGDFKMLGNNPMTMSGVTMTSGSISGASTVTIQNGCVLGSASSSITINSTVGAITVNNSTVYGNLTAPSYSTVNVTNGAAVYGTCLPNSTPANACNATPPKPPVSSCPVNIKLVAGITGNYFNNPTLTTPITANRLDGPINFDWGIGAPGPAGIGIDNFSVRWNGYVYVTQTGMHRFQTTSNDGVRLTVNGDLLIDQWIDHPTTTHTSVDVNLQANKAYPIKMEFKEISGPAVAQLRWQTPGSPSYIAIPIGVNATPVTSAGLYQCATVARYAITHSITGITCAGEMVTVTALDSLGGGITPPNGTTVTLTTSSALSQWFDSNVFIFNGSQNFFTKTLKQPTPATVDIIAIDNNGVSGANNPDIVFSDAALKFSEIPTQVAGVTDNNQTVKAIKTDPNTGVCVPQLSGNKTARIAFSCINPTPCIDSQPRTVNLNFNASGVANIPLNYSDVGQVRLQAQVDLPDSPSGPAVTIKGDSNPFVVKPYTLKVTSAVQAAAPFTANPGTKGSGPGFIPADEAFNVTVQSFNAARAITPNFGNEVVTSERNKIQLVMGCPERVDENDEPCAARKPDFPTGGSVGNLDIDRGSPVAAIAGGVLSATWDDVGSFRLEASLSGTGYLGEGPIAKVTPSDIVGRFYPDHFTLTDSTLDNSCDRLLDSYSYMSQPLTLYYILQARGIKNNSLNNYGPNYGTPSITYVAENADAGVNLARFSDGVTQTWASGILKVDSLVAMFSRVLPSGAPDGPYGNLQIGLQLTDNLDSRVLQDLDMNATTEGICTSQDCTQKRLGRELNMHYGRLRIDDAFGPETADLPVNFVVEHWTGSFWAKNESDSCTAIARNNIFYGPPEADISTEAKLTISLNGGTTTGSYVGMNPRTDPAVEFTDGEVVHKFSAPGSGTGPFFEKINLASYPWLTFDWNQSGGTPTSDECNPIPPEISDVDCVLTANFSFGSYRGHDRVIYWREILK